MDRGAIAVWSAGGANAGTLTTDSGALVSMPCSRVARYELEARPTATNPEELVAAACAGCFAMTLVDRLAAAGHVAHRVQVEARTHLIKPGGRWEIPMIRLHCSATIPGIAEDEFLAIAHVARTEGPIARALRAEITLTVSLDAMPGVWRPSPEQ
jgi:osmotically inducible protein OsmC